MAPLRPSPRPGRAQLFRKFPAQSSGAARGESPQWRPSELRRGQAELGCSGNFLHKAPGLPGGDRSNCATPSFTEARPSSAVQEISCTKPRGRPAAVAPMAPLRASPGPSRARLFRKFPAQSPGDARRESPKRRHSGLRRGQARPGADVPGPIPREQGWSLCDPGGLRSETPPEEPPFPQSRPRAGPDSSGLAATATHSRRSPGKSPPSLHLSASLIQVFFGPPQYGRHNKYTKNKHNQSGGYYDHQSSITSSNSF